MIRIVLLMFLFVVGCSSTNVMKGNDAKEMKNGLSSVSDKEKVSQQDEQDVKGLDLSYSANVKTYYGAKGKYKCAEHLNFKKEEWTKIVESGFSCVKDKNWTQLSSIAEKLSHNHLKAPWGAYYKSIVSSEKDKDYMRALWMCDLALKKAPANNFALYQKARVKWLMGEETESYEIMASVAKSDPKNYEAALFLGNIHYRDREYKKAISYYKKIMKNYYRNSEYRAAYAESLFFTGKFQDSIKHYKAAAQNDTVNAVFYYRLGVVYKNIKNWNLAKSYLNKSISQRRKGRSIASLEDKHIREELKFVEAKIAEQKNKGVKNEKNI